MKLSRKEFFRRLVGGLAAIGIGSKVVAEKPSIKRGDPEYISVMVPWNDQSIEDFCKDIGMPCDMEKVSREIAEQLDKEELRLNTVTVKRPWRFYASIR